VPDDVVGGVVKVIELVGSSPNSFSDAVRNAVKTASRTIRNIRGVDVLSSSAEVGDGGELTNYRVNCKIAFVIESGGDMMQGDAAAGQSAADTDTM
jgi:flavin-binding protein dodecin